MLDLAKVLHGFHFVVKWILQNRYRDFSELLHGFVKVVSWICRNCLIFFRHLPNKTKLKFDQDFKVSALNKRYLMSQSTHCRGSVVQCFFVLYGLVSAEL